MSLPSQYHLRNTTLQSTKKKKKKSQWLPPQDEAGSELVPPTVPLKSTHNPTICTTLPRPLLVSAPDRPMLAWRRTAIRVEFSCFHPPDSSLPLCSQSLLADLHTASLQVTFSFSLLFFQFRCLRGATLLLLNMIWRLLIPPHYVRKTHGLKSYKKGIYYVA